MNSSVTQTTEISDSPIAIVGLSCHYPGARDPQTLWENILAKRRQFRSIPEQRLPLSEYYDADPGVPDKTYGSQAAVIDGFEFDWVNWRIPKAAFDSNDIVHWLALETAGQALDDAGYLREQIPTRKTGVIVGNTLTGEQTRASTLRLRWSYVRRALRAAAQVQNLPSSATEALVETMEQIYKSAFAAVTEDSLAGGLSNTIAGRICNTFNLDGGGYTVDGACSSSLLAVITAANALRSGELDLALAGGVDVSLDPFELVGFAKVGALAAAEMLVYDRRASGFIPGEGCGFIVLKRLADARADGDYVYAVLNGWGISSDGKGGITAPSQAGQAKALRRAYERAGYSLHRLDFIEGHGTGTPVGDRVELEGIAAAVDADAVGADAVDADREILPRSIGITSFKSIVGHTKAAAGIGGLIKAVMAVNQRIIPPTAGCKDPNPVFDSVAHCVYPVIRGTLRSPTDTLHAGVSAMGFGGINSHVTLTSADAPALHLKPTLAERSLLVSHQDTELFVLSASSIPTLLELTQTVIRLATGISLAELTDLAAQLAQAAAQPTPQPVRAAMLAGTPNELTERLQQVQQFLEQQPLKPGEIKTFSQSEIWISNAVQRSRVGFLFPGQGSQKLNMARVLVDRYQWAQDLVHHTDQWLQSVQSQGAQPISRVLYRCLEQATNQTELAQWQQDLAQTDVAQPAICLASVIWSRYLERLGIKPVAVGGHSLGELTAFQTARAFDVETLLRLAAVRGQAMSTDATSAEASAGMMASLGCSQQIAETLSSAVQGYAVVANLNSDQQTVISGDRAAIEAIVQLATDQNIRTHLLPVSHAFHSQRVAPAAEILRMAAPVPETLKSLPIALFSSVRGTHIRGVQVQPGINLREHFAKQVTSQVDFISLIRAMSPHCDLLVEVGSGQALSGLANSITAGEGPFCLPVESKPGSDRDLNRVLATFFVQGGEINWEALYENRLVRPFVPASQRQFIENPCERPFQVSIAAELPNTSSSLPLVPASHLQQGATQFSQEPSQAFKDESMVKTAQPEANHRQSDDIAELLLELVEERTGFPKATLALNLRLLDDLNLDSIKAADLVVTAAKRLGIGGRLDPAVLANATLTDVVATLQAAQPAPSIAQPSTEFGTDNSSTSSAASVRRSNWVRNFAIESVPQALIANRSENWSSVKVLTISDTADMPIAKSLHIQFKALGTQVESISYQQFAALEPDWKIYSYYLAILPQTVASEQAVALEQVVASELPLSQIMARLRSVAHAQPQACVTYVQFGGGDFGRSEAVHPANCCAAAFARSLHLERSDLRVRVVDLAPEIEPDRAAGLVIAELAGAEAIATVGYDANQVRRVPQVRVQQPAQYRRRFFDKSGQSSWSQQDVILVTGGAKGITAECALAFAQSTGVKMALVGRSPAVSADEVAQTLARFQAAGITCRYYSCNIVDAAATANLVEIVTAELGSITAVIHGAGLNQPRRIEQVSLEVAQAEVSPKLIGAYNLLQALPASLRLFAAFSSIIGVTGMPGNAWYGFANEALEGLLRRFQKAHPETQVLSLAYSVWNEVGMGVRLGSIKLLERMGIQAIPLQEGVDRFLHLMEFDPGTTQVVIAARLAGLDTWSPVPSPDAIDLRFIEQVRYVEFGVELVARTHLSLKRDLYLQDHIWRGSYLFPTVFGLEAMAQAVAYVTGTLKLAIGRIENISLQRPIVVDPAKGVEIEIHAEVREAAANGEQQIRVSIRTEQTDFSTDHFAATFVLGELAEGKLVSVPQGTLELNPQTDLYGGLLFQGERFQRMGKIFSLTSSRAVFQSGVRSEAELGENSFEAGLGQCLLLGDPYFRDVLLQSVQLTIPQDICLPIHIAAIEFFQHSTADQGARIVTANLLQREDREYRAEVTATDEQGYLTERIVGYRLRILEEHPENPTAEQLASLKPVPLKTQSNQVSTPAPKAESAPLDRQSSGYTNDGPQGQPVYQQRFQVSFKESGSISRRIYFSQYFRWIGKIRELPMESIASQVLTDFLSGDWGMVTNAVSLRVLGEATAYDLIQARAWVGDVTGASFTTYIEFCKVLTDQSLERLAIAQVRATWVQLKSYGVPSPRPFPSYLVEYLEHFAPQRSASLDLRHPESLALPPQPASLLHLDQGAIVYQASTSETRSGKLLQSEVFQTTLEESNLVGNVYYGNYFIWQGRILDLFLYAVAPEYLRVSNPKGEMLCLYSHIDYLREAMPFDRIRTLLYVESVSECGAIFNFEFFREQPDGNLEKLHVGQQEIVWVERCADGTPNAAPLPPAVMQTLVDRLVY